MRREIRHEGKPSNSFTKVLQGPNESYTMFVARLTKVISRTVEGESAHNQLERVLAFENANDECKRAVQSIRDQGTIWDYIKACCDIQSETRKIQLFAETLATALNQINISNSKYFQCGQMGHIRRNCPNGAGNNKPQRVPDLCPKCKRGQYWVLGCR